MAKPMTKSAIVTHLAQRVRTTKAQAAAFLDELAKLAAKEAKNSFVIPGIGKLVVTQRKARMGRNPQTGEPIKIPARRVLKFRVAKTLRDAVLGKK